MGSGAAWTRRRRGEEEKRRREGGKDEPLSFNLFSKAPDLKSSSFPSTIVKPSNPTILDKKQGNGRRSARICRSRQLSFRSFILLLQPQCLNFVVSRRVLVVETTREEESKHSLVLRSSSDETQDAREDLDVHLLDEPGHVGDVCFEE